MKNYLERNFWLGTRAERLTVTPFENAYWIEEDTGELWGFWFGVWHPLSGVGGGGAVLEGPGIDLVGAQVGLGGDTVLLYDDIGNPVTEYATVTLALASALQGQMVVLMPGTYVENITIPAGVCVTCFGNNSKIYGSVTLSGHNSQIKGIVVELIGNTAGTLTGVTGPDSGIGLINDCVIVSTNNGTGNAYGTLVGAGSLIVRNSVSKGFSVNINNGYGLVGGAGDCFVTEGCQFEGTTERVSGDNIYGYNLDMLIRLLHADGSYEALFSATNTGLASALAAAVSGDIVILPAGTIDITGGGEPVYTLGSEISTGSIPVTNPAGTAINGLTPGNWYAIEATGGPWYYGYVSMWCYRYILNDGSGWSAQMGMDFNGISLGIPPWVAYYEMATPNIVRVYFQATSPSVQIGVGDSNYGDNWGTLNWKLSEASATLGSLITIPAGVELVGLGENSILEGNVTNEGICTNFSITGALNGSGVNRMLYVDGMSRFSHSIRITSLPSSPLQVDSSTLNVNLNSDLLDGYHATDLMSGDKGDNIQSPFDYSAIAYKTIIATNGYQTTYPNALQHNIDQLASTAIDGIEYQAITYWDEDGHLVIGSRRMPGAWTIYTYVGISITSADAHRDAVIGIDKNGYLHIAYDHKGDATEALKYRMSTAALDTWDGTLTDALAMLGTNEDKVIYPMFFNDPNGELYFLHQNNWINEYLYKYNIFSLAWEAAAGTSTGGLLYNDGGTHAVYMFQPWFDDNFGDGGYLHLFALWTTAALYTRSNPSYVRWDGADFTQADGSVQTIPITPANSDVVDILGPCDIEQNTGAMSDANGHPHATYVYEDAGRTIRTMCHAWHDGSSWIVYEFPDTFTYDGASGSVGVYPRLVIDNDNVAYIIYVNNDHPEYGILIKKSGLNDFTTWEDQILLDEDINIYMPKFDAFQWRKHKVLYLPVIPYPLTESDYPVWVIEYCPRGWGVYDADAYPSLHANDIDTATGIHHTLGTGANQSAAGNHTHAGGTDEKAKVSANDTTAGYLNGKLVAGLNITLTELNDGGNETLSIAATNGGGKYRQFLYALDGLGDFVFLTDTDGNPLMALMDLE